MAANRILYVNSNPASLIQDEQLLAEAGYEVDSVFGADGLMACGSVAEYASVLIDDEFSLWDRKKMISWLRSTYPRVVVLRTTGSHAGPIIDGIYLREATRPFADCGG